MVRRSDAEWKKEVKGAFQDWDGKCFRCGGKAVSVHGIHQHGAVVPVCKKCHDDIHQEERRVSKAAREARKVVDPRAVRAKPKAPVRARKAKPSYDDIPEGC